MVYEIHSLNRRFSSLLSDAALDRERQKAGCFISIPQTVIESEIHSMVSRFKNVEQMMGTLRTGPTKGQRQVAAMGQVPSKHWGQLGPQLGMQRAASCPAARSTRAQTRHVVLLRGFWRHQCAMHG